MIFEVLRTGRDNATSANELAAMFNCTARDITRQINRERINDHKPICAGRTGYYLPETVEEFERYRTRLKSRIWSIARVYLAIDQTCNEAEAEQALKELRELFPDGDEDI